jgi:hypothetical protein
MLPIAGLRRMKGGIAMTPSIEKIEYQGLSAVEITTSKARLTAITGMGPRIAHFGKARGRNLLFWDNEDKYKRGDWRLMGGHRIWSMRPLADESEEAYAADNESCELTISKSGVNIVGPVHPVYKTRKSLGIKVIDEDTFAVESRVENVSDMLWSGGVWGLTCTLPKLGCAYGIPLGQGGAWDVFTIVVPKRWGGGNSSLVNDPAVRFTEDCLVVTPKGRISKRAVQAPQGIIGMTDSREGLSFIKKTAYSPGANYPLNCNVAYYVGDKNFMVEMESMGPNVCVTPGQTLSLKETWMLRKPVDWKKLAGAIDV